jgi:hypothetical protein
VQYHWYLLANNVKLECLTIVACNVQPIGRFQGQATDVDIARKEIRNVKIEMVFFSLVHIFLRACINK